MRVTVIELKGNPFSICLSSKYGVCAEAVAAGSFPRIMARAGALANRS